MKNNGGDGDNWELNNVRNRRAGAIGWRVPYDETLAGRLPQNRPHTSEVMTSPMNHKGRASITRRGFPGGEVKKKMKKRWKS